MIINDDWAIVTITKKGIEKALKIQNMCPEETFHIYTLNKYNTDGIYGADENIHILVEKVFSKYKTIIFIMAAGIVVRIISPLLQSKTKDPAILVMDDKGKYVISLLSGHLGGGNKKTYELAEKIGAAPVITTASDTNGKTAVDTLAMKYGFSISGMTDAKNITAMIVNEEPVAIVNEWGNTIYEDFPVISKMEAGKLSEYNGLIYVSPYRPINLPVSFVHLIPRQVVIGIGCKKGIKGEEIINFINSKLGELNIHSKAVYKFSTVEVKKNEPGIIEAASYYKSDIDIIPINEIKIHEHKFEISPFVKKSIGVGNVCEPCGYITSNFGECLMGKTAHNGVTISIWKKN